MAEKDFGEWYKEQIEALRGTDQGRVHVETVWRDATRVAPGDWVMYLPLEITEGAKMVPRVAQVRTITRHDKEVRLHVEAGIMIFRHGERVQVVV